MFNLWENGHKMCMCLTFWAGDIESRCTTIESLPSARDSIVYLSVNASYLLAMWRSWFPSAPARLALEISADAAQGENLLDLQQIAQSIFLFGFVTVYIYVYIYVDRKWLDFWDQCWTRCKVVKKMRELPPSSCWCLTAIKIQFNPPFLDEAICGFY